MHKRVLYRHIEKTPVLEEFTTKHLEKIAQALKSEPSPIYIDFTLQAYPDHAHNEAEIIVKTPHYDLVAHKEGPDLYQEINKVTETMLQEIRNAKEEKIKKYKKDDYIKTA
jgi:ribosome-associated translation inhibitor RaiA